MVNLFLQVTTALCCVVVLIRTEPALNRMGKNTQLIVRISFYQICVSAGAELLAIVAFNYVPGWREAMLSGGLAALLLCERRLLVLARMRNGSVWKWLFPTFYRKFSRKKSEEEKSVS